MSFYCRHQEATEASPICNLNFPYTTICDMCQKADEERDNEIQEEINNES
jgi:hypothetical protein